MSGVLLYDESYERSSDSLYDPNDSIFEPHKIFVGGIKLLRHCDLVNYFSHFGTLTRMRILRNPFSGRSRGFAFVSFFDQGIVQSILGTHRIKGILVGVERAKIRCADRKIFVGGVPPWMSDAQILDHFEQCGPVLYLERPINRYFCFLVFQDVWSAREACRYPQKYINGRYCGIRKFRRYPTVDPTPVTTDVETIPKVVETRTNRVTCGLITSAVPGTGHTVNN